MTQYFIRRLLLIIPTFLGITLMVFAITRLVPGGPVDRMIAAARMAGSEGQKSSNTKGEMSLSAEQIEELKAYYELDKPMLQSYVGWMNKVVRFDLGTSTRYQEPVWEIIRSRLPISIGFGLASVILTYAVCIPLGVIKARKHGGWFDTISSVLVFFGYAIPGYVVGIILLVLFASHWELFPLGGLTSDGFDDFSWFEKGIDIVKHTTLPLIAYMAGAFAVETMMMKNTLMENLSADYVRTAIAKGLPFKKAVYQHAFQNSLIPLATHFGSNISAILMGSFLIETIFNINGMGLLGFESTVDRDYPVVMGVLVISSLLFLIGNILSDICVALVDPRVQFK